MRKDAINPPTVPAKAIVDLFGDPNKHGKEVWKTGKHFILDDEKRSSALSLDKEKQDEVWKMASKVLGLEEGSKI